MASLCRSLKQARAERLGALGRTRIAFGSLPHAQRSHVISVDGSARLSQKYIHGVGQVLDWCKTAYSEVFGSWMHLVAVRLFVESILRYGLPPSFVPVIVKPHARTLAHPRALRGMLADRFGRSQVSLWSCLLHADDAYVRYPLLWESPQLFLFPVEAGNGPRRFDENPRFVAGGPEIRLLRKRPPARPTGFALPQTEQAVWPIRVKAGRLRRCVPVFFLRRQVHWKDDEDTAPGAEEAYPYVSFTLNMQ